MHTTSGVIAKQRRILSSVSTWQVPTLLYYLAVLLGLVVLYGKGDVSTAGFIYQAF